MKLIDGALGLVDENLSLKSKILELESQLASLGGTASEAIITAEELCDNCLRRDAHFLWANDGESRWACERCPA